MRPTRWPVLAAVLVVATVVAWVAVRLVYSSLPPLTVWTPVLLLVLAAAEGLTASTTRARLAGRPRTRPIHPLTVARLAALAKASSPVGALSAGLYAGVLLFVTTRLDHPAPASDARVSAVGIATGLALTAAALWLERVCRVKRPPEGSDAPQSRPDDASGDRPRG